MNSGHADQLMQQRVALWNRFVNADVDEQPAVFGQLVASNDVLDEELAFEMICTIRDNHEHTVFAEALRMLQQRRPDLFAADAPYYLDWQLGDALVAGNHAALPALVAAIAANGTKNLDEFYASLDKLLYYDQLWLAAQMMAQAHDQSPDLADDAFVREAMNITLLAFVERNPDVRADDEQLRAALDHFAPSDHGGVAYKLAQVTGHDQQAVQLHDFVFQPITSLADLGADPAVQHLDDLSLQFLGAIHREQGASLGRGDIARKAIRTYFIERHAGRLQPIDTPYQSRSSKRRQSAPPHQLCPDYTTLDRFLGDLLNLISPQYYDAAAMMEFLPAWLDFLQRRDLLGADQRVMVQNDLRQLMTDAIPVWDQIENGSAIRKRIKQAWMHS